MKLERVIDTLVLAILVVGIVEADSALVRIVLSVAVGLMLLGWLVAWRRRKGGW